MNPHPKNNQTSGNENGNYAFLPPHSDELEQGILGIVLLESTGFEIANDILNPNCFYEAKHKIIWEICLEIYKKGYNIDLLIVADELRKSGKEDEVGGAYYLTKLTMDITNGAHLNQWCVALFEKYQHREMIKLCQETMANSQAENDIFEVLEIHEKKLTTIMLGNTQTPILNTMDVLMSCEEDMERIEKKEKKVLGLTTGFPQFDGLLSGLKGGNLILIAARPSIGKSALAMNLAVNASIDNDVGGQVFSLEMPVKEWMFRMISSISKVPLEAILRGETNANDKARIEEAKKIIIKLKILFDDTSALNITQMKSILRRLVLQDKIGFAIIDYIQIMGMVLGLKFGTRDLEISFNSRNLKAIAKELNIPIIALCQLNRAIEARQIKKPMLSDLRESGSLEQDADVIIFMTESIEPGFVDFHIAKNRNGKTDEFQLPFDKTIQTFFHRDTWVQHTGIITHPDQFITPKQNNNDTDDLPF